jgi:alpha-D-ribose 1-methylphosphonate 5-triphosphate diphosphatase PhnM
MQGSINVTWSEKIHIGFIEKIYKATCHLLIAQNMHVPRDWLGFVKHRHADRFVTTYAPRIQVQWPISAFYKFSDLSTPMLQV